MPEVFDTIHCDRFRLWTHSSYVLSLTDFFAG
jgi:hypothetical protein